MTSKCNSQSFYHHKYDTLIQTSPCAVILAVQFGSINIVLNGVYNL